MLLNVLFSLLPLVAMADDIAIRPSTTTADCAAQVLAPQVGVDLKIKMRAKFRSSAEDIRATAVSETHFAYSDRDTVYVVDLKSGKPELLFGYSNIAWLDFVEGTDLLAVAATKSSDGKKKRLYLVNLKTGHTKALDLMPSRYHGVGVQQILSRPGLPYLAVIQDSANDLDLPGPNVQTQGLWLFDSSTMQPLNPKTFSYDGLVPKFAALNPANSTVALLLADPITANIPREAIVVVDLVNPEKILFRHDFAQVRYVIPLGMNTETGLRNSVQMEWSKDGRALNAVEHTSGTVVTYNAATGASTATERADGKHPFWPTAGGGFLPDGESILIRQGHQEVEELKLSVDPRLLVYLSGSMPEISERGAVASFELQPSLSQELQARGRSGHNPVSATFVLREGRILAFVLRDQIVFVDRENSTAQTAFSPNSASRTYSPRIRKVIQADDRTLRVVDYEHGVADIEVQ